MEEESEVRHEYFDGRVFSIQGGAPERANLIVNLCGAIGSGLRGTNFSGSTCQLIKIARSGLRTYPDILVSCPPEEYDEDEPNALLNPVLIVEVSSPSPQNYDRTEKRDSYRRIPALRDYVLVSSERVRVEHLHRNERDEWILWTGIELDSMLRVPELGLEIPLDEIYEGLELLSGLTRI